MVLVKKTIVSAHVSKSVIYFYDILMVIVKNLGDNIWQLMV